MDVNWNIYLFVIFFIFVLSATINLLTNNNNIGTITTPTNNSGLDNNVNINYDINFNINYGSDVKNATYYIYFKDYKNDLYMLLQIFYDSSTKSYTIVALNKYNTSLIKIDSIGADVNGNKVNVKLNATINYYLLINNNVFIEFYVANGSGYGSTILKIRSDPITVFSKNYNYEVNLTGTITSSGYSINVVGEIKNARESMLSQLKYVFNMFKFISVPNLSAISDSTLRSVLIFIYSVLYSVFIIYTIIIFVNLFEKISSAIKPV